MRLRDQIPVGQRPRPARQSIQWGVREVRFYPASGMEDAGIVNDAPQDDTGDEIPICSDLCAASRCYPDDRARALGAFNLNAHGNGRNKEPNPFPPGSAGVTAGIYQGDGEAITRQIEMA